MTGKDVPFLLLVVSKHGGQWDVLGRLFNLKGPTFERMITRFASQISNHMYTVFVTKLTEEITMQAQRSRSCTFNNHPEARYAVYDTFQQSAHQSGSLNRGKLYLGGKHKLYG